MKKIDVGQSITILANIGVIVGIAFLAIEINGNTAAVRAQELAVTESITRERQMLLATNPSLRSLLIKSLYSPSELTTDDLLGITAYLMARVETLRQSRRSFVAGTISEEDWEDDLHFAPIYLGGSFARVWWGVAKDDFSHDPDFIADVDRVLASPSVVPDDAWYEELERALAQSGL